MSSGSDISVYSRFLPAFVAREVDENGCGLEKQNENDGGTQLYDVYIDKHSNNTSGGCLFERDPDQTCGLSQEADGTHRRNNNQLKKTALINILIKYI